MRIEKVNAVAAVPLDNIGGSLKYGFWHCIYFERYRQSKIRHEWKRYSCLSYFMHFSEGSNAELLWLRECLKQDPNWSIYENKRDK